MRAILFISFMISFSVANAQKSKTGDRVEIKTFKMPKFPIADFPKKSIAISDIQVIQMLRDSIIMGYAMKGMDDHVVALVTEKPTTLFLQQGIYKMYSNDFKEGGTKLLWVIKELRIGEKIRFNQFGYLRFNAESYISSDEVNYKPVCTIDTVIVNESTADVTAWHGEHIQDAFRLLLKRTMQNCRNIPQQTVEGTLTIEKIKEQSKPRFDVPILQDEVYEEGAYANFDEFLRNSPSVTNFRVFSIGRKREIKFVKISANNQADTINIWGFCKGGEIFKYEKGLLVSIEKQRNGFIISNYVEQTNRRNTGVFVSAFLGGMVGGIIVGIAAGSVSAAGYDQLLVTSIPYITKSKKQPEASCIEMETGELSF